MDSAKPSVAEAPAATEAPSFLKSLFQGEFQEEMVFPFPEIPPDVKETVAAFSEAYKDFDAAYIDSDKIDQNHFFPREAVKAMGELGVLGMTIPEEYGGSDFSSAAYCRMMEVIGVLDASASIVVGAHQSIGIKPLLLFGTDEQKKKWLPDLATGKLIGAFCLTEPEAGSDAGSLKTTAVYDEKTDEYVLNGTKQWISNGGFATFLSVFARIPGSAEGKDPQKEIACFAVVTKPDGTLPGLSRGAEEKKLGLCASSTCQIIFENCRIPAGSLIGGKGRGFKIALDDTGAGYASLRAVMELAPDFIKLDSAFVASIDADQPRQALVQSLAVASRKLGARIIAEGIETQEELGTLRSLGIPLGQGFLLGRPKLGFGDGDPSGTS